MINLQSVRYINWYDFYSGQLVGSHTTLLVNAEELNDQIPLFVKDGALIPMLSKDVLNTEEIQGCDLEVRHYGTIDGRFELYEDDGRALTTRKDRTAFVLWRQQNRG